METFLTNDYVGSELDPDNKLKLAILKDAILCLKKRSPDNWYGSSKTDLNRTKNREAAKALAWIKTVDYNWPFSFDNICTSLKIDPDYLRSKLC